MSKADLRWGIIGTGNIANQFVADLSLVSGQQVIGVASRVRERALAFADRHSIPLNFGRYEDLLVHPEIDIVYVATPHSSHAALSIAAMHAGKHVLCEKPFAVNAQEVEAMITAARANQVFLMEALWTRFNPSLQAMLELIHAGEIGQVNYISADFSFFIEPARQERLMNPSLAGGSLLEMGVYPVFLAYLLLGYPAGLKAISNLHEQGADWQTGIVYQAKQGLAMLMSGFLSQSDMVAKIYGTEGRIYLHPYWHETHGFLMENSAGNRQFLYPTLGKGFTYEIEACANSIGDGILEHPLWSHQHSLELMQILDEIRKQAGIKYRFE